MLIILPTGVKHCTIHTTLQQLTEYVHIILYCLPKYVHPAKSCRQLYKGGSLLQTRVICAFQTKPPEKLHLVTNIFEQEMEKLTISAWVTRQQHGSPKDGMIHHTTKSVHRRKLQSAHSLKCNRSQMDPATESSEDTHQQHLQKQQHKSNNNYIIKCNGNNNCMYIYNGINNSHDLMQQQQEQTQEPPQEVLITQPDSLQNA